MSQSDKIFKHHLIRSAFTGIVETGIMGFSLLIAIRVFDASQTHKIWIAAGVPIGFILTSFTVFLVSKSDFKAGFIYCFLSLGIGIFFLGAAASNHLLLFVLCIMGAKILSAQISPILIQIYALNFDKKELGKNISYFLITVSLFSGISSYLFGKVLDHDLNLYRVLYCFMGFSSLGILFSLTQIPSRSIKKAKNNNPLKNLSFYYKDKLFGWMLTMWMFMGIGNLMTLPQRIEYLANEKYGLSYTNEEISIIVMVVPSVMSVLSSQLWGRMFDRCHFIPIRCALNVLMLIGIVLFFNSSSFVWLSISTGIFGFAMGGATITWNLWVTKIAPPGEESAYMSVHTTLNGIRGIFAPSLGYFALDYLNMKSFSMVAAACMLLSIVMLFFVWRHKRFA